jgi:hypothetical protein
MQSLRLEHFSVKWAPVHRRQCDQTRESRARLASMRTAHALGIALLLCAAAPSWADETTDRLVTTFAKVCLAKPDSMSAMNTLAAAQGFALDKPGAAALADAESKRADPFNLLLFWRSGTGNSRTRLNGLISGSIDRYELGCVLDGYDVPPQDVLAALKRILGEPARRTVKENDWIELAWTATGDVTLSYREGGQGQRVGLTFVQIFDKATKRRP